MGTTPLEPGLFRSHVELLGTTLHLLAIILLKSVFMLGRKKKQQILGMCPGGDKFDSFTLVRFSHTVS